MKKLTALLLAVLMVLTLAACQKTSPQGETADSVVGNYVLTGVSDNGEEIPLDSFPKLNFTLNEDNTGIYGTDGGEIQITWSQDGNTLTFVADEVGPAEPLTLTVEGNTLIASEGSAQLIFAKQ